MREYSTRGRMARKSEIKRKKFQSFIRRTSWSAFASIWQGKERPITPWIIDSGYPPRPLRKKRRESRLLRKHHY